MILFTLLRVSDITKWHSRFVDIDVFSVINMQPNLSYYNFFYSNILFEQYLKIQ